MNNGGSESNLLNIDLFSLGQGPFGSRKMK